VSRQAKADHRETINEFIAAPDAEATLEIILSQWQEYYAEQPPADDGCECVLPLKRHDHPGHVSDERRGD
jgi:hypothetical protein